MPVSSRSHSHAGHMHAPRKQMVIPAPHTKLIEVSIPLEAINTQAPENGRTRPGG
jgi:hypothetical protein